MCKSKPWDTAEDETKGIGMMNKGQVMKGGTSDIDGEQFRGTSLGLAEPLAGPTMVCKLGCVLAEFFQGFLPGCFSVIPDRAHQSCLLSALHATVSLFCVRLICQLSGWG